MCTVKFWMVFFKIIGAEKEVVFPRELEKANHAWGSWPYLLRCWGC
jgi:hypothetical protein